MIVFSEKVAKMAILILLSITEFKKTESKNLFKKLFSVLFYLFSAFNLLGTLLTYALKFAFCVHAYVLML